jgi:hypothetical protein
MRGRSSQHADVAIAVDVWPRHQRGNLVEQLE